MKWYRPDTLDQRCQLEEGVRYQLPNLPALNPGDPDYPWEPGDPGFGTPYYPTSAVVPVTPDADFWQVVDVGGPADGLVYTPTVDAGTETVTLTWHPPARTPEQAADEKELALDARWNRAMDDGVPMTINGVQGIVRYQERDRNRFAGVHDPAKVPAPGLLVIAMEPVPAAGNRTRFTISGALKITELLDQGLAHRNQGDMAWDAGYEAIDQILEDGGLTDAQKVTQIDAIDVESYNWPDNTF